MTLRTRVRSAFQFLIYIKTTIIMLQYSSKQSMSAIREFVSRKKKNYFGYFGLVLDLVG